MLIKNLTRQKAVYFGRLDAKVLSTFTQSAKGYNVENIAFAFDIDGVLIRGKHTIPGIIRSLQALETLHIPFIFITNGGGCTELSKAKELSSKFLLKVESKMVLLSHSPMRDLTDRFHNKRVLALGTCSREIAQEDLGLGNVATVDDIANEWPCLYPFQGPKYYLNRKFTALQVPKQAPVEAVLVLHDPLDWAVEAQVVVDVLRGGDPPGRGSPNGIQTPYFISNPDFVFAAEYPYPRFAAGAFTEVVKILYLKRFGVEAVVTEYGKPTLTTFKYAEKLLAERQQALRNNSNIERIFMVGDNPSGDIKGANAAGSKWISNLVRTGIFEGSDNDFHNPADFVYDNVNDCVKSVLLRAGINIEF